LTSLPPGLTVQFKLSLRNCKSLVTLPRGLKAGSLDLAGCTSLSALPEDFDVSFLDISDCPQLCDWPRSASLDFGRLRARNSIGLTGLPGWLKRISQLDIRGCRQIDSLPAALEVTSWVDLAGTGIRQLPTSWKGTALRWRG